jgi:rod shape-determining protein MreC
MESVLGRYRNLTILVGVLFLQVLGLAVQVKRTDAENTRLIRIWAVGAVTPFERGLVWMQNSSRNLWHNYFYLRGVRAENRDLKAQIEQMRLEQVRMSEDATQAHRLQQILNFKEQYISKTVAAQVIGSSGSDLSRSVYIDKGSNDGVEPDMAVITANGIVGKVLRVYASTSLVLMINDQTSGVGAMLEKSRLQGVLRGTPNGEVILERVMSDEQVTPGETVLSSGGDQIFPKGLPVGTVSKVSPGREMFLNIQIKPSADLNRLEEVLVVTQKQERDAVADALTPRVRAADILAQRLPSVPDKPAGTAALASGENTPSGAKPVAQAEGTAGPSAKVAGTGDPAAAPKSAVLKSPGASTVNASGAASKTSDSRTADGKTSGAKTSDPKASDLKTSNVNAMPGEASAKASTPRATATTPAPASQPPAPQDPPH